MLIAVGTHLNATGVGEIFAAPFDVVLSSHDVVDPDLLVILKSQFDILTNTHVRGAPAIVVEILSPGTRRRDEGIKRALYERVGVQEYWLVDLRSRSIEIWAPGESTGTIVTDSLTWRPASLDREIILELPEIFSETPPEAF